MARLRHSLIVPVMALCVFAISESARASATPKWSVAELSEFADVVVTGRVETIASGWDATVGSIYTYVTVNVEEVFKGQISESRIVVKQLGGYFNGVGLAVADQATFAIGEHVLLYLEARPRDGSLYTSALWQGKWTIETTAGGLVAVRTAPEQLGNAVDRTPVIDAQLTAAAALRHSDVRVNTNPADAASASVADPYSFLGPGRWLTVPPVDVHSTGQPGLPGGGFNQILSAINRWNAAGTGPRLTPGTPRGPLCGTQLTGNGRVSITFMDPCSEISNTGGTLAIGGFAYIPNQGGTRNGTTFHRAVEGYIINNDSNTALNYMTRPGCFEDIQTHELGHVLGLGHSSDPNAIMFPSISNSCVNGAHALGQDDIAGLIAIYGSTGGTTPPSTAPTNVRVQVNGLASITVSWGAVTALTASLPAAATSYRLDFRTAPTGPVLVSVPATGTSITIPLPPGTVGTFYVTVTGVNAAGAGPSSAPVQFTIGSGGPGPCTSAPPPVTGLAGDVANNRAFVSWVRSVGATSYVVQAGSTSGGSNHFPATDVGDVNFVQATVPSNFSTFVTVFARNACGLSPGVTLFIQ